MKTKPKHQNYRNLRICFVSLNAYHLSIEKNASHLGGAEVQQIELSKELTKRGYDISFIVYGNEHGIIKRINGIKVFPVYKKQDVHKLNLLRKMMLLWRKMKEVDADVYYCRAGSPGIVTIFCKLHQKKIIKSIASDAQVTGEDIIKKGFFERCLGKLGTWFDNTLSDIIIAQSNFQKSILEKKYNVKSFVIRNAFNMPKKRINKKKPIYILWVGTIRSVKQPSFFLKIAKHFPEYKFLIVGGQGESIELFRKIKNATDKIPNLSLKGFVPHNEIFEYYKKAVLLVNTSKTEGFPNVFLEAWMHSLPVVSLNVDPDGIITKYKLGYCSKNYNRLIDDIRTLLEHKKLRQKMGKNGREYVEKYHDIKKAAGQYEDLFREKIMKFRESRVDVKR